jgi:hypothetical protein
VSCSTVDCRARFFFLSSRQHYLAGAARGEQGTEPELRYFCSIARIPGSNFYGTSQVARRDPTLNYPGDVGPPMPALPRPPAPRPPWRRSVPSGRCKFNYYMGSCAVPNVLGFPSTPHTRGSQYSTSSAKVVLRAVTKDPRSLPILPAALLVRAYSATLANLSRSAILKSWSGPRVGVQSGSCRR